jgi:hypothetical protein
MSIVIRRYDITYALSFQKGGEVHNWNLSNVVIRTSSNIKTLGSIQKLMNVLLLHHNCRHVYVLNIVQLTNEYFKKAKKIENIKLAMN